MSAIFGGNVYETYESANDFSKDDVESVQPSDWVESDVELGSGSVGLEQMGHSHIPWTDVSVDNGLIGQSASIDGPTPSTIEVGDVSPLHDEVLHESVDTAAFVAEFGLK